MLRSNLNDLVAFMVIAREKSFTRAASQLGISPSALSHAMRGLEERLGVRLLSRSTRSVAPTEAGERLLISIAPRLEEIETELSSLGDITGRPRGTVRINASQHAMETVIWPKLATVLSQYPDVQVELHTDNGFSDIVAERFDMGVRLKEALPGDMIAVQISDDLRMVAVASPAYFSGRTAPVIPQDLTGHQCINMRMLTYGGHYQWEFEKDGQAQTVKVDGQLVFNSGRQIVQAAVDGFGIAFVMEDTVSDLLASGALVQVLADWCPRFPGYYLYYPNRRHHTTAFSLILEALKAGPVE